MPSLSVLDGWWIEGHIENITGWSIGGAHNAPSDSQEEATSLYEKLESVVLPMYYSDRARYDQIRRGAIAYNGSFFTTQRMVGQYVRNAYRSSL